MFWKRIPVEAYSSDLTMDLDKKLTQSEKSPNFLFVSIVHGKPGDKKIPDVNPEVSSSSVTGNNLKKNAVQNMGPGREWQHDRLPFDFVICFWSYHGQKRSECS